MSDKNPKPKSKVQRVVKPNECYEDYDQLFEGYEPYTPTNKLKKGEGEYYLRKKKFA